MHRTFAVASAIGALVAVSLALVVPTGAGAAQTPPGSTTTTKAPTIVEGVCQKLDPLGADVDDALSDAQSALTAARTAMDGRRAAMTTAMGELATAVVNHLAALDAKGNTGATGAILKDKKARYVDTVVAWSKARALVFDGEQQLVFGELQKTLLDAVNDSAC